MNTETRDREFAAAVDEIAAGIRWPDPSFALNPWETAVGMVIAFYEAVTTPNRVIVRFALNGLAL
ncbi:MAG: hypothetical protein HKN10_05385 [Myxococcales bacterium]|nr:hypothetical protein [Deltaproteobacteria bacterium]NNE17896.1 hypothetical protein [Myxococcales bacterium]